VLASLDMLGVFCGSFSRQAWRLLLHMVMDETMVGLGQSVVLGLPFSPYF